MQKKHKVALVLLLLCCFLAVFFWSLFLHDNKYNTSPPYGQDGVLALNETNFSSGKPIYLIDGWRLTDKTTYRQKTYIGEFSNLQRGDLSKSPHGAATYELILQYDGSPRIVVIDFPELFTKYKIHVNGNLLTQGHGSARIFFELQRGDNLLTVETSSYGGYYSGMYFPAAFGDEAAVISVERVKTLFYSICTICPLILMSFTIQLWRRREKDKPSLWLAVFSIFFVLYSSHYFVQLFSFPFAPLWYYAEDFSLYGLVFCMVQLTHSITGLHYDKNTRLSISLSVIIPVLLLTLHAMIPYWKKAVWLHGRIKNIYFILTFLWLLGTSVLCIKRRRSEYPFIVAANLIFGAGLLINLFQSNLFEPIYSLWQFEWCGLLLIWLFSSMMVSKNHRIMYENKQFTTHLESLVEQRTEELSCVLEERRAFFSDMAHDLKSPLFATKTFIQAIRSHRVGVDEELKYYLDQLDSMQTEMSKRVQSLGTLNALDKLESKREKLSVSQVFAEVFAAHNAEAEVCAVHLVLRPPEPDCFVFMQPERLLLAFENLIFNALHATPINGSITITAKVCTNSNGANTVQITVDDTGCGISEVELPLIFKRFYVGESNRVTGSGLGLYIVKTIFEEVGGRVSATSQVDRGSRFLLEIPLCI